MTVAGDIEPQRTAVIDIGSNTVRLVVYDQPGVLPIPMFNEKSQCQLGRNLAETGRLNPEGVTCALRCLARFARLAEAMGVKHLRLVATAAVRDAEDGPDFVRVLEHRFGYPVRVLTGQEEAHLAALGLLSGVPDADGALGDMGGGSLDMVALDYGAFGDSETLPLGHLRLAEAARGDPKRALGVIDEQLARVPWLSEIKGRTFYAVGGSWRALGLLFIQQTDYPLHVIDGYSLAQTDALHMVRLISGLGRETLERIHGVARKRAVTLGWAAMALERVIEIGRPRAVTFSGFGMREGQIISDLPGELRQQDPLILGCRTVAARNPRFSIRGRELSDWMAPIFDGDSYADPRLDHAAGLLSDIGWTEHPDYRARHSFHRILRLPFAGLTHQERAFLALAVYVRYNGEIDSSLVAPILALLDEARINRARVVGLALRLAHTLSGSAPGLLVLTGLKKSPKSLKLLIPDENEVFVSDDVERRLKTLAKAIGLAAKIDTGN